MYDLRSRVSTYTTRSARQGGSFHLGDGSLQNGRLEMVVSGSFCVEAASRTAASRWLLIVRSFRVEFASKKAASR